MTLEPGPIGTTGFATVQLVGEATEYVRLRLTELGLQMSQMVAGRLPEFAGLYFAIVPSGTSRSRACEFKTGWPGPLSADSRIAAATVIVDLVGTTGQGFVVGEDFNPDPAHPAFTPDPTTLVAYGRAYQLVEPGSVSVDAVANVLCLSDAGWVSNVVVALPDTTHDPVDPKGPPEQIIDLCASHAVAVLVRAFDGQGYVLWLPSD